MELETMSTAKKNLPSLPEEIARAVPHAELPERYEIAKAALAECNRVDELDDCADKAAALASYARQADDPELLNHATRIRARAVRRMGELLLEYDGRGLAKSEGPPTLSREEAAKKAGISRHKALTAARVGSIPQDQFEELVESPQPPGTTQLAEVGKKSRRFVFSREKRRRPHSVEPRYEEPHLKDCTASEVVTTEYGPGFAVLYDQCRRQLVAIAFESQADAEQSQVAFAGTFEKAKVIIRGS